MSRIHPPVGVPDRRVGEPLQGRVVRRDERGRALGAHDVEEEPHDRGARLLIQLAGRLVRQQQARPVRERAGDRDALLLAARHLGGALAGVRGEAHQIQQLGDAGLALVVRRPAEAERQAGADRFDTCKLYVDAFRDEGVRPGCALQQVRRVLPVEAFAHVASPEHKCRQSLRTS
jgi:hypothetical protein